MFCFIFFFFKQKTAYEMRISDWSSDVCSSDLSRKMQQIEENGETKQAEDDGRHSRKIVNRYLDQVGPAIARRIFLQIKGREHPHRKAQHQRHQHGDRQSVV